MAGTEASGVVMNAWNVLTDLDVSDIFSPLNFLWSIATTTLPYLRKKIDDSKYFAEARARIGGVEKKIFFMVKFENGRLSIVKVKKPSLPRMKFLLRGPLWKWENDCARLGGENVQSTPFLKMMKGEGLVDGEVQNKYVTMRVMDLMGLIACGLHECWDGTVAEQAKLEGFPQNAYNLDIKCLTYSLDKMSEWEVEMWHGSQAKRILDLPVNVGGIVQEEKNGTAVSLQGE